MILACSSCESIIDFNGETKAPLLVVNSILQPDSIIVVQITKSKFFLSSNQNFPAVRDATVKVTVNDIVKETLTHIGEGYYKSNIVVKENDRVQISAEAPDMDIVKSQATVQPKITIISIDTVWIKSDENDSYYSKEIYDNTSYEVIGTREFGTFKINVKFKDNSDTRNYYRLRAKFLKISEYVDSEGTHELEQDYNSYYNTNYDDIVFGNTSTEQSDFFEIQSTPQNNFFTDDLINGKEYAVSFNIMLARISFFPGKEPQYYNPGKFKLSIYLDQLSKDYYLYQKTASAASYSNTFFSEPIQVHNNIEGGIGIFGSCSISNYKIYLGNYTPDYYNYSSY